MLMPASLMNRYVCGALLLGQPQAVWIGVGVLVGAVLLLAVLYSKTPWPTTLRFIAATFKTAAIALLLLCLLEPLWSGTRARPGENLVLLVADSSASLQVADGPQGEPRSRQFEAALSNDQSPWQVRLAQDFRVRKYSLAQRVDAVQTFDGLAWDGQRTALGSSLQSLLDRYRQQPLAAVLLFTDGNATDAFDPSAPAWRDGPPIFPVVPVTREAVRDVSIERTSVTQSSFEDAPVTIQADIRVSGGATGPVIARLLDDAGAVVEEQTQTVSDSAATMPFRFQVRPLRPLTVYTLQVREQDDVDAFAAPPRSREATFANNQRLISVRRDPGPYRVLYVGGRPNWEFKFLRRGLAEDADVQLVGLIRMARREAKFEFLGREGESSNPLYRGFRKAGDEETESYDEAVVIALGVRDEHELAGGKFPRTPEELYQYHAVILDDVEAGFFTTAQQALLERFVSQRGGGLLMLGGPHSFHHGNWHKSPLKDVLPVYFDRLAPVEPASLLADPPREFRLQLTRDGWLQPWVRLRPTEPEERARLGEMSGFQVVSRVNGIKPAAQVLANVIDVDGRPAPALVAQSYGDGRAAALLIGDMWRWSMKRESGAPDDLGKAWRQTVRWMVADVPKRIAPTLEWTTAGDSDAVALRVRVRNESYEPQENAAVRVRIAGPGDEPLTLTAEPALQEPGLFETLFVPRSPGAYTATFDVTDASAQLLGSADLAWTFEPAAEEFRHLPVNRDALQRLAEATGGEVLRPDDLPGFVQSLPAREAPRKEAWTAPLWHSPWMLSLILAALAGEWGLRRWKGLP